MKTLAQEIANATDHNEHTEAALIAARALNGKFGEAARVILEEIANLHELQGYLESNQQTLRDSLNREVCAILKIQGKI